MIGMEKFDNPESDALEELKRILSKLIVNLSNADMEKSVEDEVPEEEIPEVEEEASMEYGEEMPEDMEEEDDVEGIHLAEVAIKQRENEMPKKKVRKAIRGLK